MEERKIRVVIADDHGLICQGLRMVLERGGMEVVGVGSTGRQAVELTVAAKPDVLILDIRMPDMDGLEALAEVKNQGLPVSVIMLTSFDTPEYLAQAVAKGAAGFLSKSADVKGIPEAVRAVVAGEAIVDRQLLQAALDTSSRAAIENRGFQRRSANDLTEQETRVLRLVAEGLDNNAIAASLGVSRNTVKTHVHNIFSKLGVSDRTQAAILAMRMGLSS
ncbi:MAG: response regulator transcription factor [Anaerolineales bacterium]|nr:response regulator transcription factor [Anaerolineales bacterium]